MYLEDFESYSIVSKKKVDFFKNNILKYFFAAFLAGVYAGLGCIFTYTVGAMTTSSIFSKILMGISFGGTLCIIYYGGTELFTGNNMLMTAGALSKKIKWIDAIKLWIICWIGNLSGAILFSYLFFLSGLLKPELMQYINDTSAYKMNVEPLQLIIRAIFCNMFVCLATWCSVRFKSETAKVIMIFWCLYAFLVTGYEHSIANMAILFLGVLNSLDSTVNITGYFYNLSLVTLGNVIGGMFLGAIYYYITKPKNV